MTDNERKKPGRKPRVENSGYDFAGKFCRNCRKFTRMEDFATPRTYVCLYCQERRIMASIRFQQHQAKQTAEDNDTPALTYSSEGMRKYHRDRYRALKMKPKEPPLFLPDKKYCMRCRVYKPIIEFGSWRIRICKACDGPDLQTLWRHPQRTR